MDSLCNYFIEIDATSHERIHWFYIVIATISTRSTAEVDQGIGSTIGQQAWNQLMRVTPRVIRNAVREPGVSAGYDRARASLELQHRHATQR